MIKNGYSGKNGIPSEWNEYQICSKFGWTPDELYRQDMNIIAKFIQISNIEANTEKKPVAKKSKKR